LIGSFIVVTDATVAHLSPGTRVNLGLPGDPCKDAEEARRRIGLLRKNQWPPQASDAAASVRESLEGAAPEVAEVVQPVPVSAPQAPSAPPPASPPAPPPAVEAEAVHAEDPVAALNASVTEEAEASAEIEAEAKAALAGAGLDVSEVVEKAPAMLAGLHLWLQGHVARLGVRVVKGRWPKDVVTLPDDDPMRPLIGKLWVQQLKSMNLDLENVSPGWWLVILSGVTAMAQIGGMLAAMDEEDKQAAAAARVN
jgi:hypothetical protein